MKFKLDLSRVVLPPQEIARLKATAPEVSRRVQEAMEQRAQQRAKERAEAAKWIRAIWHQPTTI